MKKNNQPKITIGIPTCYGGASLVKTVESIEKSCKNIPYLIHIASDTTPIKRNIKAQLGKYNVKITWNKVPNGQFAKDKQIIKDCQTDVLIITQDDVTFASDLVPEIITEFSQNKKLTMLVAKVVPEKGHNILEKIVSIGADLSSVIAQEWNMGDNYLAANGRCMAFRTSFANKFSIPDVVVSGDAYLYFENKQKGGKFKYLTSSFVKNKSPFHLNEHLNQSKRFQNTKEELEKYIKVEKKEFRIPIFITFKSLFSVFISHSFFTLFYLGLLAYSRWTKKNKSISAFWDIDISTKRL